MTDFPSRQLLVFDVDGTLTNTNEVDSECYLATVRRFYGESAVPDSWAACPIVTDAGILSWIHEVQRGGLPSVQEVEAFRTSFCASLREHLAQRPGLFSEIKGAGRLLTLMMQSGVRFAVATGGWRESAIIKLTGAGLPVCQPTSSADDASSRTQIFELARQRADALDRVSTVSATLIGDGLWDLTTAVALGWAFVAVGIGESAEQLRAAGAHRVIPDFRDPEGLLESLRPLSPPMS